MSPSERIFQQLWRPEVMFILMLIAIYGIIGEMTTPGAILPGVVGAIALILALYLAAILPVNVTGLVLIALAMMLFIFDIYAPTHGVLTLGGIISFLIGSLMLFNRADPLFRLSLELHHSGDACDGGVLCFRYRERLARATFAGESRSGNDDWKNSDRIDSDRFAGRQGFR